MIHSSVWSMLLLINRHVCTCHYPPSSSARFLFTHKEKHIHSPNLQAFKENRWFAIPHSFNDPDIPCTPIFSCLMKVICLLLCLLITCLFTFLPFTWTFACLSVWEFHSSFGLVTWAVFIESWVCTCIHLSAINDIVCRHFMQIAMVISITGFGILCH